MKVSELPGGHVQKNEGSIIGDGSRFRDGQYLPIHRALETRSRASRAKVSLIYVMSFTEGNIPIHGWALALRDRKCDTESSNAPILGCSSL